MHLDSGVSSQDLYDTTTAISIYSSFIVANIFVPPFFHGARLALFVSGPENVQGKGVSMVETAIY